MDWNSGKIKWNKVAMAFAAISVIMIGAIIVVYVLEPDSPDVVSKEGTIGIIAVEGVIDKYDYTSLLSAAVNEAVTDDSIKAVVVKIDSPGGSAHLCEQVYLDLVELSKIKPVVGSCSIALSGGYYIAVSSEYIFAQPSSMVGSVGVLGVGPSSIVPSESSLETGPHKITGFSQLRFPLNISKALDSFANAVTQSRGDKLKLTQAQLRRGSVWLGKEAVLNGLIDEIGSQEAALNYAAKIADLDKYKIINLVELASNSSLINSVRRDYVSIEELNENHPPPSLYYLYIPGDIYMQEEANQTIVVDDFNENATKLGQVVVDLSHGNLVSPWVFDIMEAELAKRGIFMGYSSEWETIQEGLNSSNTLIIAAPKSGYTFEEFEVIWDWVEKGNLLVLFSDPSSEFTNVPELLGPINSLANHWGLHFGKGYLYNQEDHYGIYRNIYLRTFEDTFLTEDLDLLLFFTSTYLSATDSDAAYASWGTANSVNEKVQLYAPVGVLNKGNNTVVAFADLTWQMEPYIYMEDNYQLLLNLVDKIVELNSNNR